MFGGGSKVAFMLLLSSVAGAEPSLGSLGVEPCRRQPGELRCGVVWFLHVPKTGGATVQSYLLERTRRRADGSDGNHSGEGGEGKKWLFVDIHNGERAWAQTSYGSGNWHGSNCEPGLSNDNMSAWSQSPAWRRALRELDKPEPRLVVHQESCNPSIASLLPQLAALNSTLHAKGRGCGLHLVTVLREPVALVESALHFVGTLTRGSDFVLAIAREQHAWHVNQMTSYILLGPPWMGTHKSHPGTKGYMTDLVGLKYKDYYRQYTAEEQQRAAEVLEKFGLVGSTASLKAFLARLSALIGDPDPLSEVKHIHNWPRGKLSEHARNKRAALVREARARVLGRGHPDLCAPTSGTTRIKCLHAALEGRHTDAEALGKEERAIEANIDASFELNDADRAEIRSRSTADLALHMRFTHTDLVDDAHFVDRTGRTCANWSGSSCFLLSQESSDALANMKSVRAACPVTCGLHLSGYLGAQLRGQ